MAVTIEYTWLSQLSIHGCHNWVYMAVTIGYTWLLQLSIHGCYNGVYSLYACLPTCFIYIEHRQLFRHASRDHVTWHHEKIGQL